MTGAPAQRLSIGRAAAATTALLIAAAIAAAALSTAGADLFNIGAPHDALPATLTTARSLLVHNALVALWPLALVGLGWPHIPGARHVGDALIGGQLLAHGALIGTALAQHPELWRYLPHLPAEAIAITAPAATWLHARRGERPNTPRMLAHATTAIVLLVVAALLETYAVPIT
jgi:hypothetical protein